ncbi:MAG: hypothetical protein HDR88_18160 [Bacteroides sp.]|nr:hypothetical protein [Bacteroides sp.]
MASKKAIKPKRSKTSKKPTKQQIRERNRNKAHKALEKRISAIEAEGFQVDRAGLLSSRELRRNKNATDKEIGRIKSFTKEKLKNSKYVSYKGHTGTKGASFQKWDVFYSKIGTTTQDSEGLEIYANLRKPEKVEQWKNPNARKLLRDPKTGKVLYNDRELDPKTGKLKPWRGVYKIDKDYKFHPPIETPQGEPEKPEVPIKVNAKGALDELAGRLQRANELMPTFTKVLENLGVMVERYGYEKTYMELARRGAFYFNIQYGYSETLHVAGEFMRDFENWVRRLQDSELLAGGCSLQLYNEFKAIAHYSKGV